MKEITKIGFLGLGNIGMPMAVNMVKGGWDVIGYAPSQSTRDRFEAAGGKTAGAVREVAEQCDYIVTCLPTINSFNEVCRTIATFGHAETVVIETSTMPIADKVRNRDLLAEKGIYLIDAPLSGTGAMAAKKNVIIFASGDQAAWESFAPVLPSFTKNNYYLGEFGNGMKMKFVANHLVAVHNVAAAEAVLFAQRLGLDPAMAVKIAVDGGSSSAMLAVRGPVMVNRSWSETQISNRVFHKDLVLIDEALQQCGVPASLFYATLPTYAAAIASGHSDDDTASTFEVLERMSTKMD